MWYLFFLLVNLDMDSFSNIHIAVIPQNPRPCLVLGRGLFGIRPCEETGWHTCVHAQLDSRECWHCTLMYVHTAQFAVKCMAHTCAPPPLLALPPSRRVTKLQRLRTAVIIDQKLYPSVYIIVQATFFHIFYQTSWETLPNVLFI